ncbi:CheB methylesterase domain-containing protein [uncultured Hymenobacter sp.]|uniref:CheB methylesterase domain-containing protein n=1 Tax=uncultured Hymenobacter sp. TaxID=170016 RepID=UPI0035CCA093
MPAAADSLPLSSVLLGRVPLAVAGELVRLISAAPDLRLVGPAGGVAELAAYAQELRPAVIVASISQLPALAALARLVRVLLYDAAAGLPPLCSEGRWELSGSIEPLPGQLARRTAWRQTLLQKLRAAAFPRWLGRTSLVGLTSPTGLVIIGASTGGPAAVEAVLTQLRPGLRCAVVVAVHLPAAFTASLVARLRRTSALPVAAAEAGSRLLAGQVVVVPGGTNMVLRRLAAGGWSSCVASEPATGGDVPSVDLLMTSAAATGGRVLGVVLTGLGHDGRRGARAIREQGGQVLVQDAASAAVFSMPGAVLRAGWASAALPLAGLAAAINEFGREPQPAAGVSAGPLTFPTPAQVAR